MPTPTRKRALAMAVAVSGSYLVGLLSPGMFHVALPAVPSPPIVATGVVTFDRQLADDGYVTVGVLFDQTVNLVAKDGQVVHSWHLPYPLGGMATMSPDGSLLYLGKLPNWSGGVAHPSAPWFPEILQRLAWDGRVIWTHHDELMHHDFAVLPDGTIATFRLTALPAASAARVPGGIPGSEDGGTMWTDQVIEIDPATGAERVVFDYGTAWRPEDHPLPDFMPRSEWTHSNGIFYVQSDPVSHQEAYLVSAREVSTLMLISRQTGKVIWQYGGPWVLDQQHDPTMLPDGHVLVFDDGQYRRGAISSSQVLEIDPVTNKVVWSYAGYGVGGSGFYSPITGGAQRLPNGNTLTTLGTRGQILEVTSSGRIVWDYRVAWGPVDPNYPVERMSFLFKSRDYPAGMVSTLLAGHKAS